MSSPDDPRDRIARRARDLLDVLRMEALDANQQRAVTALAEAVQGDAAHPDAARDRLRDELSDTKKEVTDVETERDRLRAAGQMALAAHDGLCNRYNLSPRDRDTFMCPMPAHIDLRTLADARAALAADPQRRGA